jgi:hypothetical protein
VGGVTAKNRVDVDHVNAGDVLLPITTRMSCAAGKPKPVPATVMDVLPVSGPLVGETEMIAPAARV